jgi:hypothetical protein
MKFFGHEVAVALKIAENNQSEKIKQYLDKSNQKIYIIGKNDESTEFASRYKVDGVIDDYNQSEER